MLTSIANESMTVLQWGVVIGASLLAVVGDVRNRRIPNALTFPLLLVGLGLAGWYGGTLCFAEAAAACILLALPYVLLFVFADGGAGDAKLMGAIGTWLGLKQGVIALVCVASAGVVLALAKAIKERRLKSVLSNVSISFYLFLLSVAGGRKPSLADAGGNIDAEPSDQLEVPYGVAIAAGVVIAAAIVGLWGTEWLWSW